MNKDNPALRDALNGAIKAIRADGTYDAIQKNTLALIFMANKS